MSRNQNRVFGNNPETPPPVPVQNQPQQEIMSPFNFVVPTEIVDLPSEGQFYPENHPLHNMDSIEIKHMTAKEEDILTSPTLLKKGVALDKMLQSIIIDKRIKVDDLLIGDKNALLVKSRVFGYGADYHTSIVCTNCNHKFDHSFDLDEIKTKELEEIEAVTKKENGHFEIVLPRSNLVIEFRLLTSKDEKIIMDKKSGGSLGLLKHITVSVNEQKDKFYIEKALQSLPIIDASIFKKAYLKVMPDLDMTQEVECPDCTEISEMGVPLNADFFWPDF
jgi:hypothetical protein